MPRLLLSREVWAAVCAVMLLAAAPWPVAAGERATLRVTARVVDRCTVEVPDWVPPWVWRDRRHQPWRLVRHLCRGGPPLWIHVKEVLLERLRDRLDRLDRRRDDRIARWQDHEARWREQAARVHEGRHRGRRDVVLITITY